MALLFTFGHCKSDCKSVCSCRMLCSKRWIGMSAGETLWRAFPEDQLLWVAGHPSLHKKTNAVLISEANMKWRMMWTHFHVKNDRMKLELQPETNVFFSPVSPNNPCVSMCIHVLCVDWILHYHRETTIDLWLDRWRWPRRWRFSCCRRMSDLMLAGASRIFGWCGCVPVVWCFSETELL